MTVGTTVEKLLECAALMIVLNAPVLIETSQAAKSPPAKTDAKKQAPDAWLLAGREGECAPLSMLAKKGLAYENIKSPAELVEKLRVNGHKAEMKEFKAGTRPAVEVRAPSAGIHVMFIKKELCDKPAPPPVKK